MKITFDVKILHIEKKWVLVKYKDYEPFWIPKEVVENA